MPGLPFNDVHRHMGADRDFFTNPNHPIRRRLAAMERRADPGGDFLRNPNNPIRRQLAAMQRHADPLWDLMNANNRDPHQRTLLRWLSDPDGDFPAPGANGDDMFDWFFEVERARPGFPGRRQPPPAGAGAAAAARRDDVFDWFWGPGEARAAADDAAHRDDVFDLLFGLSGRRPAELRPRRADARADAAAAGPRDARAAAGGAAAARAPGKLPPLCTLPEDVSAAGGGCAICLEDLRGGQGSRRPPCLHAFHDACLSEWLRRSSECPVCKLDLDAPPPPRGMRYRLRDLECLAACELKYIAGFLGLPAERGAERSDLEAAIVSSSHVRIVCGQAELLGLPVRRLRALLASAKVPAGGLAEKRDLVDGLLASGRFVEESVQSDAGPSTHAAGVERARRAQPGRRPAPY
mmetsp:Transcript_22097/g.69259  ORF Transcript_22097/g.69259 Transcript_22097/m.69259 type:complete len:408 (-) Transcript_22097:95-1318(-)